MSEPRAAVPRRLVLFTVTLALVFFVVIGAILTRNISRPRCEGRYSAHAVHYGNAKINVRGSGVPECFRNRIGS